MERGKLAALLAGTQDFAQGASNSVAANITAPVDILAWLLRKSGVPVPENPALGSEWMRQNGLTAEPKNRLMGLLGDGVGAAAPFALATKAPHMARGLLQVLKEKQPL